MVYFIDDFLPSYILDETIKDLMKLLFFNDPIVSLHTHNYGFNTATGRHIIETTQEYYYKYKNLEL